MLVKGQGDESATRLSWGYRNLRFRGCMRDSPCKEGCMSM